MGPRRKARILGSATGLASRVTTDATQCSDLVIRAWPQRTTLDAQTRSRAAPLVTCPTRRATSSSSATARPTTAATTNTPAKPTSQVVIARIRPQGPELRHALLDVRRA